MTWIGACLVAAFLLGALLGSVFSRQREDAKRDQSHADKLDYPSDANQETSIAALARSHIAFAKDYYSTRERDTAHSRKTYKVSFWTAVGVGTYTVFTFIIVIFSVVQYGENHRFNKRQLRFFNDQVGVMRGQLDEMRSDRRPWVSVNQFIGDITWDKDGFHIAVRTNIENTGKSPAFGVLLQQELFPIMGTPEINGPSARVRQISAEQRQRNKNTPIGFPVFPGKTEVSVGLETYSRDKIAALNAYIKKMFRSPGKEKPSEPAIEEISFLPIVLIYVVSYFFDVGEEVHETYCFASINETDETNPFGSLLSPPVDVNLPASRVRLVTQPIGCNAD